ncbi:zinc-binding dehydrogenase [Actinomadura pelletieri]|uniref:zinc-binding dehydrogenase n=1 Tax=Actinomadura pelletieri TaxID=111805 RepID=UPI001B871D33|nr:zinc-binding dehydrogenase [Actinomadura pelletieri]
MLDGSRADLADVIMRLTGGVDLVLESVGRTTFEASLSMAKPYTGRIVVFGAASGDASLTTHDLVFRYPVQVRGLHIGTFASAVPHLYEEVVAELHTLIAKGVYLPGSPHVHPLADGPQLLQNLGVGRTVGEHALDPWA